MSNQEDQYWFSTGDNTLRPNNARSDPPIYLRLQRYLDTTGATDLHDRRPVLLLHGASANHRTFIVPEVGLASWLARQGYDPWLLDWRASSLVVDTGGDAAIQKEIARPNQTLKMIADHNKKTLQTSPNIYNFNRAAREDLPAAMLRMRQLGVSVARPITLLGHCMGAAAIAEAVALGRVVTTDQCDGHPLCVDRIVLSALGLFYEAPLESKIKSGERILERLTNAKIAPLIDARIDSSDPPRWPDDLEQLYQAWPAALRSHKQTDDKAVGVCNRASFIFGMPYHERNLVDVIHETDADKDKDKLSLPHQFGAIPLQMLLHGARNLRAGQATYFDPSEGSNTDFISPEARARFHALDDVTLITGALNRLWHRDAIDRMHEWLCRRSLRGARRFRKHVLVNYAHQDLLWGREAPADVYPLIAEGLGTPRVSPSMRAGAQSQVMSSY